MERPFLTKGHKCLHMAIKMKSCGQCSPFKKILISPYNINPLLSEEFVNLNIPTVSFNESFTTSDYAGELEDHTIKTREFIF